MTPATAALIAQLAIALHANQAGPQHQPATGTAKVATAVRPVARIPDDAVQQLVKAGEEGSELDFTGIHKFADRSTLLSIVSARSNIAFTAAKAAENGGRYTPPPSMRSDVVHMDCGDADLGERWECARLTVTALGGRRVEPLAYSSAARPFRNALGATWTVRTTEARYRLADLAAGFTVRVYGTDGTEYAEEVTAERAASELLTTLPLTKAMSAERDAKENAAKEAALAAEPTPPDNFDVQLTPTADGWEVRSSNAGYTWKDCAIVVDDHSTPIANLAPGQTVSVSRVAIKAPPPTKAARTLVRCVAKGQRVEGPVPTELAVSVQQMPDGWMILNLTDWAWANCHAEVGESRTRVGYLMPSSSVHFLRRDFTPAVPYSADGASVVVVCAPAGRRIVAVRR